MDVMGYYLLFAFSTSLTACYSWFWPILSNARNKGVTNSLTKSPVLSIVIYILITTVIAPIIVFPILIPKMGESFARGLERELLKSD
jgi:hypothetical protein